MKVERIDLGATKIKLLISADAQDLEPIKNHVLAHFRHSTKVPGFRAGTAPLSLIEKHIDQKQLLDEFLDHALNQLYGQAVNHQNLRPVGQPNVQLKKFVPFTDLEMEIETDVISKIDLADYKKIKLARTKVVVPTKEIDDVLRSLQTQVAERQAVDRAAKTGDEVIIDFKGKDKEGKSLDGTDAHDYALLLGSGNFIPGFEDELMGLKTGQNKVFKIKFPKDYGVSVFQNKEVNFEVSVKKVNELKKPQIDNKLAAKAGPFKTLTGLKADIKKELTAQKQQQADREYENQLLQQIVSKSKVDIPKSLIESEIDRMEDEEKRSLAYQGKTWQEHLTEEGINEQQHRERQRAQAEERIKGGIVLSEIADKEGVAVSEDEVQLRKQLLKGQHQDPAMQAELDKPEARRDLEARLITEKTITKLIGYSSK